MAVLMPDGSYYVLRPYVGLDAQRSPVRSYDDPRAVRRGPFSGRSAQGADEGYTVALDPAAWPVQQGDAVIRPDGVRLIVLGSPEPTRIGTVEAVSELAYVRLTARALQARQQPESDRGAV